MNAFTIAVIVILCIIAALIIFGLVCSKLNFKFDTLDAKGELSQPKKQFNGFAKKYMKYGGKILAYGVLVLACLSSLFPFFWMIASSLKTSQEFGNAIQLVIFPAVPQWNNYALAWQKLNAFQGLLNTMIIEVATIPVCVFISAMEAFAFSKMYMRHKNVHLLILLSGLMIPYASIVLPLYRVYNQLNLINTFVPLILPPLFGAIGQLFFYVQYQKGIPDAIFESGKIDGASYFQQYIHLMLPMMGPAIAAQTVFMFIGNWNDYFAPSLYLVSMDLKTLQLSLKSLADGNPLDMPFAFAGATMTCLPLFAIYLAFQKYFVGGLAVNGTGVKG